MAVDDPIKDALHPSGTIENTESQELREDDLKAVTGGLSNSFGANVSASDTGVCVSTD